MSAERSCLVLLFSVLVAVVEVAPVQAATAVAVRGSNLLRFDTSTPGTVKSVPISGLVGGDTIVGIDLRPADGSLYALGSGGRVYQISPVSGAAITFVTLAADPGDVTNPFTSLTGTSFGFDFNPVVDRLRVTSDVGQNLRIDVSNGRVITDDSLNPGSPNVVGSAYSNSFVGAGSTTLFAIDSDADTLLIQNPANSGSLASVGAGLGVGNIGDAVGFDIDSAGGANDAYAALSLGGPTAALYTIDLTLGTATAIGSIGGSGGAVTALAIVPFIADVTAPAMSLPGLALLTTCLLATACLLLTSKPPAGA